MGFEDAIAEHRRRLGSLIPGADARLTGSASVAGLAADDVDLVVLVDDVATAAARVAAAYAPLYPQEWSDDWAAFRDPGPPQVDIVLTRAGTRGDAHHRRAWQLLAGDPALLAEYRELKATRDDYEMRKAAFFERVVALLDERPLA
jgi:GrpB-like predicted nucleotidyltransferase (UPF0157 family)